MCDVVRKDLLSIHRNRMQPCKILVRDVVGKTLELNTLRRHSGGFSVIDGTVLRDTYGLCVVGGPTHRSLLRTISCT
jgi:hypothetical protein